MNFGKQVIKNLWRDFSNFRRFFPAGSTVFFPLSEWLMHDFTRGWFSNGRLIPHHVVDSFSGRILKRVFPNFPYEYQHKLEWVLGIEEPPNEPKYTLVQKALDTFCKLGVVLDTFFEQGGQYDLWKTRNEHLFPLKVPISPKEFKTVTMEEFARRDQFLTLKGLEILENQIGINNFGKVLRYKKTRLLRGGSENYLNLNKLFIFCQIQ